MSTLAKGPPKNPPETGGTDFLTASKLKERGWTDALIRQMLAMPDDYAANYAYPGGAPVRLYRLDRVAVIEASEEFKTAKEKSTKRRQASAKAMDTRREAALRWIEGLAGPKLPPAPRAELERLAVDWFNATHAWRGDCERWWSGNEAPEFIRPVVVDFIMEQLEGYQTKLLRAVGKTPQAEDLALIRRKILAAISKSFPWLEGEIARRRNEVEPNASDR